MPFGRSPGRRPGHQGLRAGHAEQGGRLDHQKRAKPFAAAEAGIADRRHEPARPVALALDWRRAEEPVEQRLGIGGDLVETGQEILAAQWKTRFLVKGANATDITCRPQRLRCPASRNQRMASVSASVKGRAVKPRSRSALAAVKNIRYFDMRNASMVRKSARPVTPAPFSPASASGTIAERGSRTRGGRRPIRLAMTASISENCTFWPPQITRSAHLPRA